MLTYDPVSHRVFPADGPARWRRRFAAEGLPTYADPQNLTPLEARMARKQYFALGTGPMADALSA